MKVISFTKVSLPYGWLGNMAPYAVTYFGKEWLTTEALFQAMRFDELDEVCEEIRKQKSPVAAKMIAKANVEHRIVEPCSDRDVENMRRVLNRKVEQHSFLVRWLLETGDALLVEDVTARPHGNATFWGAVKEGDDWCGKNMLGKLWMGIRQDWCDKYEAIK